MTMGLKCMPFLPSLIPWSGEKRPEALSRPFTPYIHDYMIAAYDFQPYDREYYDCAAEGTGVVLRHHTFRLKADTASSEEGAAVVAWR